MSARSDPPVMGYPAIWIARSAPLAYRVMPKCACSSIGQWLHLLDHGRFHHGEIHDDHADLLKWGVPHHRDAFVSAMKTGPRLRFTMVRNPYRRLASAFTDKIFGYQKDGRRYRAGHLHRQLHAYGVTFDPRSSVIEAFRGFVRFAVDTLRDGRPMPADPHWTPCFDHLLFNVQRDPAWRPDFVGRVETLRPDLVTVARRAGLPDGSVPERLPRENATSLGPVPISALYGPEELALVREAYATDFEAFGYDDALDAPAPSEPVAHAALLERLAEAAGLTASRIA